MHKKNTLFKKKFDFCCKTVTI